MGESKCGCHRKERWAIPYKVPSMIATKTQMAVHKLTKTVNALVAMPTCFRWKISGITRNIQWTRDSHRVYGEQKIIWK